jgi:hypothetical protein
LTGSGANWTPIGQNDAITWPELAGLFRRRDLPAVERHLRWLKAHGVTCLRLMLEYCQTEHRYLEKPVGRFVPAMVQLWDDLFALAEKVGLRILLTPYDTFFMWTRWQYHPYNRRNGGPCGSRRQWLICPEMRSAIKGRLAFASERWGGSPALFAWDLWNEAHPAHGQDDPATITPFIDDIAPWLRAFEIERHGRAHPQTVSIFGPELLKHPQLVEPIFRHPALDFATTHLYEAGTIDNPRDTVAPALAVGRLMRAAVNEAGLRPVFDSEHGPIHSFKDRKKTLSEAFDDEYFHNIQWAHFASGGAGGGMRWPNRHPHVLTQGMRRAQLALSRVVGTIEWTGFARRNLAGEIVVSDPGVACFACGDGEQAMVWLLRADERSNASKARRAGTNREVRLAIRGLAGALCLTEFETNTGEATASRDIVVATGEELPAILVERDVLVLIRRTGGSIRAGVISGS